MKRDVRKLNDAQTVDRIGQSLCMREAVIYLLQSRIPKEEDRLYKLDMCCVL